MKYIKTYEHDKPIINHKKYVIVKEMHTQQLQSGRLYEYSIRKISPNPISSMFYIELKRISFFSKNCKEIKDIKKEDKMIEHVKDNYWIFNKDFNKIYFETDNLKEAKEILQLSVTTNKYNL